jgi:methionyl-tRNA formyltransferase
MKIVFAASAGIAVPCLKALAACPDCEIAAVLSNVDSAKGRSKELTPTEVAAAAEVAVAAGAPLKILKPQSLNDELCAEVAALKPDLLVSFAYGKIFTDAFLKIFPKGGINVHPSLLPKYRGASPIQAAILNMDSETGISIQRICAKLDCGDILLQEAFPLDLTESSEYLSGVVAQKAPDMLLRVLRDIAGGTERAVTQPEAGVSFCREIKKEDGRIDWTKSAAAIDAQIRAYTPWPLSFSRHGDKEIYLLAGKPVSCIIVGSADNVCAGTVLGVDKKEGGILVQTGSGVYCAASLQYKTKKALEWTAFLNGARDFIGSRLS